MKRGVRSAKGEVRSVKSAMSSVKKVHKARMHGSGLRMAHASSIDEKGPIV